DLLERMNREAFGRRLVYYRGGQPEPIRVMARPLGVMSEQLSYLNFVSLSILGALKRLPQLYLDDAEVRRVVPLADDEQQWLRTFWHASQRENNPVFGRLDATVDFTSPMWKDSLKFLEPNLCGVGGLHYGPASERMLADLVMPLIHARDPELQLEVGQDLRELFIQEVLDHLEAIGRRGRNVCFIEPTVPGEGPDEQEVLAQYYRDRHGLRIMHADPSELELDGDEVRYQGEIVDIAYRDYEVRDLAELGRRGTDIGPMRALFAANRVISSIAGDFDHKSCWEVLTDPALLARYFQPDERQVFRRHILWTRLLYPRRSLLADGETGDLVSFVRAQRELLVLKPNRAYGGEGVLLGHLVDDRQWDDAVDRALAAGEPWVVQRLANLPVNEFPVVDAAGRVHLEPFYTVMGFAPTKYGIGIVGRASQKQVVNVAQRGGMCAIFVGRSPRTLVGPDAAFARNAATP
ncbi:MAG TPA: hypothetical protein VHY20_08235, partial [Pirellulales bacterium]|nr:hypothetical protein [Pirellulales bacterium]